MSMVMCSQCDAPIDSDEDVDSWVEMPMGDGEWVCERCREARYEQQTEVRNG